MIIYSVVRRKVKASSLQVVGQIFYFSPSYDDCLDQAKILASRYKRRYLIQANSYDKDGNGIQLSALTFVRCAGKGQPVIVEPC